MLAKLDVIFECIWFQRFLEPVHIIIREHLRRVERPFVAIGPERIAAAGVNHEQRFPPDSFACSTDDRFVERGAAPSERSPSYFKRAEPLRFYGVKML